MPNGVKYSTTTPSGSLRRGNVALGVTSNLGPSATTGFYSMPAPQSGKYIINKVSPSGIPNFFAPANDAELIRLAQQEGAVGADTGSAAAVLDWMTTQDNLEAVNFEYENIVTDGLVLNLDAGFVGSYPTTGTTWYDISGNNNHAIMGTQNNQYPVFSTNKFFFNGSNSRSYFYNGSAPTLSGNGVTAFLVCELSSYNTTTNNRLYALDTRYSTAKGYNGNGNSGVGIGFDRVNATNLQTFNFVTNQDNGGSYTEAQTPTNYLYSTKYVSMVRRQAGSSDITILDTNSSTIVNPSYTNKGLSSNTVPSDGYSIGCWNGNLWLTSSNYWFSGNIYQVLMYNRFLTDSEVNTMTSILKTKFSI